MGKSTIAIVALLSVFLSVTAAQSVETSGEEAVDRVALVIGNSAYRNAPQLPNPQNDARAMSEALREVGFDVLVGVDLTKSGMVEILQRFSRRIHSADVALFFYAGHGLQVYGQNFLVPVDAELQEEVDLDFEAMSLKMVLRQLDRRQDRTNLVFLDACRDNPLARNLARSMGQARSTGIGRGLSTTESGLGTLIAYATQPGNVAVDGYGSNSPFTAALSKWVREPGLEVRQVMSRVRQTVIEETEGKQVPWDHSSLIGDFYFKQVAATTVEPQDPSAPQLTPQSQQLIQDPNFELAFWNAIKDSRDTRDFEDYLTQFPEGLFVGLARRRMDSISPSASTDRATERDPAPSSEPAPQVAALPPAEEAGPRIEEMDMILVATAIANLRDAPNTRGKKVGRLLPDEEVNVLGRVADRDWYQIAYKDQIAYVYAPLLKQAQSRARRDWEAIKGSDDLDALRAFQAKHPTSLFARQAQSRIELLQERAKLMAMRQDLDRRQVQLAAWQKVRNSDDRTAIEAYLAEYPDSPYTAAAQDRISALDAEVERQRQRAAQLAEGKARRNQQLAAWRAIKDSEKAGDFEAFLADHPDSPEALGARRRLAALEAKAEAEQRRRAAQKAAAEERRRAAEESEKRREAEQLAQAERLRSTQLAAWQSIEQSNRIADFESYLADYGDSPEAAIAERHRDALTRRITSERRRFEQLAEIQRLRNVELGAWAAALEGGQISDIEAFLVAYPNSPEAGEAQRRIAQLQAAEESARRQSELREADSRRRSQQQAAWQAVQESNNTAALEAFLAENPDSPYAAEARQRIAALDDAAARRRQAEQVAAAERKHGQQVAAWDAVRNSNDPAVLASFLQSHADSPFVPQARQRLEQLEQQQAALAAPTATQEAALATGPSTAEIERYLDQDRNDLTKKLTIYNRRHEVVRSDFSAGGRIYDIWEAEILATKGDVFRVRTVFQHGVASYKEMGEIIVHLRAAGDSFEIVGHERAPRKKKRKKK